MSTAVPPNQQMYPGGSPNGPPMVQGQPATPATGQNPSLVQALSQPGYLGGVAGYNASTAGYDPASVYGAQYDPSKGWNNVHYNNAQTGQLNSGLLNSLGVDQTLGQIQTGMAPQTQQAEQSLNQQLAEFGVGGGQAIQANQQLQGSLAGGEANAMAAAIQNAQGNMLGAGQFDVGQANQMGLANAQNKYASHLANSQAEQQNKQFNAQNQLGLNEFNANNANQMGLQNSQNALQAGEFNAGAENQAGQFNANNTNAMNQYNVGMQNQYQEALMNAILGNYGQQMGAQEGFIGSGQNAGNQNAVNYGQTVTQTPGIFQDILGAAQAAAPFSGGSFGGGGGGGIDTSMVPSDIYNPTGWTGAW